MDELVFVTPNEALEKNVYGYKTEHFNAMERELFGAAWLDRINNYRNWLNVVRNNSRRETVAPGWVLSSVFCVIRKRDDKIIGMVDIRHELNDFLRSTGGHISYGVRPSERNRGYGTKILSMALDYCRSIGLNRVVLICKRDNEAAFRTIQKNNGVLVREYSHSSGNVLRQFHIDLNVGYTPNPGASFNDGMNMNQGSGFAPYSNRTQGSLDERLFGVRALKNGMRVTIRPVTENDAVSIINMTRSVDRDTSFLSREPNEFNYLPADQVNFIARRRSEPRSMWFVAESNGMIVGTAQVRGCAGGSRFRHRARLSIMIVSNMWSQGLGTLLMDASLSFAGLNGYEQVEVESNANNQRALALLRKFGYTNCGRKQSAYKYSDNSYADALLFMRKL